MSIAEFAAAIRNKTKSYDKIPDRALVDAWLLKYPGKFDRVVDLDSDGGVPTPFPTMDTLREAVSKPEAPTSKRPEWLKPLEDWEIEYRNIYGSLPQEEGLSKDDALNEIEKSKLSEEDLNWYEEVAAAPGASPSASGGQTSLGTLRGSERYQKIDKTINRISDKDRAEAKSIMPVLDEKMESTNKEIEEVSKRGFSTRYGVSREELPYLQGNALGEEDEKALFILKENARLIREAKKYYGAIATGDKKVALERFGDGLSTIDVANVVTIGLKDLFEETTTYQIKNKVAEQGHESLTKEEYDYLVLYEILQQAKMAADQDRAFSVGVGVAESAPFMAAMAATGVVGGAVRTGAFRLTQGALRGVGLTTGRSIISKLVGTLSDATVRSLLFPSTYTSTLGRMTPEVVFEEVDGESVPIAVEGTRDDFPTAYLKSLGENAVEIFSETFVGGSLNLGIHKLSKQGAKVLSGTKFGDIWDYANRAAKNNPFTKFAYIQDPFSEFGEEVFAGIFQPLVTGEGSVKDFFEAENMIRTALIVLAMGSMTKPVDVVSGLAQRKHVKDGRKIAQGLDPENNRIFADIMRLDLGDNVESKFLEIARNMGKKAKNPANITKEEQRQIEKNLSALMAYYAEVKHAERNYTQAQGAAYLLNDRSYTNRVRFLEDLRGAISAGEEIVNLKTKGDAEAEAAIQALTEGENIESFLADARKAERVQAAEESKVEPAPKAEEAPKGPTATGEQEVDVAAPVLTETKEQRQFLESQGVVVKEEATPEEIQELYNAQKEKEDTEGVTEGTTEGAAEEVTPTVTEAKEEGRAEGGVKPTPQPTTFLKGKQGAKFTRADSSPNDSFWGIVNQKGNSAEFTFAGNQQEGIAKRVFSDDIADVEGNVATATSVTVLSPGEVELRDGDWVVVEKAKIRLESGETMAPEATEAAPAKEAPMKPAEKPKPVSTTEVRVADPKSLEKAPPQERLKIQQGERGATDVLLDGEVKSQYTSTPQARQDARGNKSGRIGALQESIRKLARIYAGQGIDLRGLNSEQIVALASSLDENSEINRIQFNGESATVTKAMSPFGKDKKDFTGKIIARGKKDITIVTPSGEVVSGTTFKVVKTEPKPPTAKRKPKAAPAPKQEAVVPEEAEIKMAPKDKETLVEALQKVFKLPKKQATIAAEVLDRIIGVLAKRTGSTKSQIYAGIEFRTIDKLLSNEAKRQEEEGVEGVVAALSSSRVQGAQVNLVSAGVRIIYALQNYNISTVMHEMAHIYEDFLTPKERATVLKWTGKKEWDSDASEAFARGFERYLRDGIAPSKELKGIFEDFKRWMLEIYETMVGTSLLKDLSPEIRNIYDVMLGFGGIALPVSPSELKTSSLRDFGIDVEGDALEVNTREPEKQPKLSDRGRVLFQIAGENANTSETVKNNLYIASKMEESGADALTIRVETGWEKGIDGKWRYEINPNLNIKTLAIHNKKLFDVIDYKELSEFYPELGDIRFVVVPFEDVDFDAQFSATNNTIKVASYLVDKESVDELRLKILHEIQHAIQLREGWDLASVQAIRAYASPLSGLEIESPYADVEDNSIEALNDSLEAFEESYESMADVMNENAIHGNIKNILKYYLEKAHGLKTTKNKAIGKYTLGGVQRTAFGGDFAPTKQGLLDYFKKDLEDRKDRTGILSEKEADEILKTKEVGSEEHEDALYMKRYFEENAKNQESILKGDFSIDETRPSPTEEIKNLLRELYGEDVNEVKVKSLTESIQAFFSETEIDEFDVYRRAQSEVEARNVEKRANMTAEERRNTLLSMTEDVARDEQIILFPKPRGAGSTIKFQRDERPKRNIAPPQSPLVTGVPHDKAPATPNVTKESSIHYANLTEDGDGNYVFFHVTDKTFDVVDPKKYGSSGTRATSAAEIAAMGKVGGMSMFYTDVMQGESMVRGKYKHAIKIPVNQVYDFNRDENGYLAEAERRHDEKYPNMSMDANSDLAYITQIASENGYLMTVAYWRDGETRAHSVVPLQINDTREEKFTGPSIPFKENYVSNREYGFKQVMPITIVDSLDPVFESISEALRKKEAFDSPFHGYNNDVGFNDPFSQFKSREEETAALMAETRIPKRLRDRYQKIVNMEEVPGRTERKLINPERFMSKVEGELKRFGKIAKEDDGGATFRLDGNPETKGLVVPIVSLNLPQSELTPERLVAFLNEHQDKVTLKDDFRIGIYKFVDTNNASIDLNVLINPEYAEVGVEMGKFLGQKELFDLKTFKSMPTGEDGLSPRFLTVGEARSIASSIKKGVLPEWVAAERKAEQDEIQGGIKFQMLEGKPKPPLVEGAENALDSGSLIDVQGNESVLESNTVIPTTIGKKGQKKWLEATTTTEDIISSPREQDLNFLSSAATGFATGAGVSVPYPFSVEKEGAAFLKAQEEAKGKKADSAEVKAYYAEAANFARFLRDSISDLLLGAYDALGAKFIERTKVWYEGANRIANNLADRYNLTLEQTAAVIASLSPQTEWFDNLSRAERVIHIMQRQRNVVITKEMHDKVIDYLKTDKDESAGSQLMREMFVKYGEVSIQQLMDKKAEWREIASYVRILDAAVNSQSVYEYDPNGQRVGVIRDKLTWGSSLEIAKALAVIVDGSQQSISDSLGNANKVRNFYNNIASPDSVYDFVTVDTHAGSSIFMYPLGGGEAGSIKLFSDGKTLIYSIASDAYTIAANKVGLTPNRLQSVIWEAARITFNDKPRKAEIRRELNTILPQMRAEGKSAYEIGFEVTNKYEPNSDLYGKEEGKRLGYGVQRDATEGLWEGRWGNDPTRRSGVPLRGRTGGRLGEGSTELGLRAPQKVEDRIVGGIKFQREEKPVSITDYRRGLHKLVSAAEAERVENVGAYIREFLESRGIEVKEDLLADVLDERGHAEESTLEGYDKEALLTDVIEDSRVGLRVLSDDSRLSEELKALIRKRGITYAVQSQGLVAEMAEAIMAANSVETIKEAIRNPKLDGALRVALGAEVVAMYDTQASKEKVGSAKHTELMDMAASLWEYLRRELATNPGRIVSFWGSLHIESKLSPRLRIYKLQKEIGEEREKQAKSIGIDKTVERLESELALLREELAGSVAETREVQAALDKLVGMREKEVPYSEKRVVIGKRFKNLEARDKVLSGLDKLRVLAGQTTIKLQASPNAYISAVKELIDGLILETGKEGKALKSATTELLDGIGVAVSEDVLNDIIGIEAEAEVDASVGEAKEAKERLAKKIISLYKSKKTSLEEQMINQLLGKFRERATREKRKGKADFEIMLDALNDMDTYMEVWSSAKKRALAKANGLKVAEKRKNEIIEEINRIYNSVSPMPFSDVRAEKAVMSEINKLGIKINKLASKHFAKVEATKEELVESLMSGLNLSDKEAKMIADAVSEAFDRIIEKKQVALVKRHIDRLAKKASPRIEKKGVTESREASFDKAIGLSKLINSGAFKDAKFLEAYKTAMGLPSITAEQIRELEELNKKMVKMPEGRLRQKAFIDLLEAEANLRDFDWGEMAMSIFYFNILSGYTTQARNAIENATTTYAELGINAVYLTLMGKWGAVPGLFSALYRGWAKQGAFAFADTISEGYSPFREKYEAPDQTERVVFKGLYNYIGFNQIKHLTRTMASVDEVFYFGLKEMRAYEKARLAIDISTLETIFSKKKAKIVQDRLRESMNYTPEAVRAAREQAAAEAIEFGLTAMQASQRMYEILEQGRGREMQDDTHTFASEGTFNHATFGTIGWISDIIGSTTERATINGTVGGRPYTIKPLKWFVPFTRIIANAANKKLSYTPVGYLRFLKKRIGFWENMPDNKKRNLTLEERRKEAIKATMGLAAMTAFWFLSSPGDDDDPIIEITAGGTGNFAKNKTLRDTGWRPYSIRIGDKWISYKFTPLLIPLSIIGAARDIKKYRADGDSLTDWQALERAAFSVGSLILDETAVGGLTDLLGAIDKGDGSAMDVGMAASSTLSRLARSASPNIVRQVADDVDALMKEPMIEKSSFVSHVVSHIPVAGKMINKDRFAVVNVLGDERLVESRISQATQVSLAEGEALIKYAVKQGIVPSEPRRDRTRFSYQRADGEIVKDGKFVVGDKHFDELWYAYTVFRGQYFKTKLQDIRDNGYTGEEARKEIEKAQAEATGAAKAYIYSLTEANPIRN